MVWNDTTAHVVILSAANRADLTRYAAAMARRIAELGDEHPDDGRERLADLAYTLQTGRTAMPHRLAVAATTLEHARESLEAFVEGSEHPAVRTAEAQQDGTSTAGAQGDQITAATDWLAGADVSWDQLWSESRARLSLPGTPWPVATAEPAPAAVEHAVTSPATTPDAAVTAAANYLVQLYADASGIAADRFDAHTPLERIGLSSFLVTRINGTLQADLGEQDRTLFFSNTDLAGVAAELVRRHPGKWAGEQQDDVPPAKPQPATTPVAPSDLANDTGAIAIVGMAGRFPQADTIEQFWHNLVEGHDSVTRIPEQRTRPGWPSEQMWGGFLDDVEHFDPLLFAISPRDAELMDPQERLFLEVVWEGLENAGYTRARLRRRHDSNVGVYVGAMHNEYPYFGVEQSLNAERQDSGATLAGIANRVSFLLDLQGPSLSVDTMCSSSLTAIHLALQSLRAGETQAAIVGAVNLSLHPNKFVQQHRMQLAATDHRCRSFGLGGDGFVPAEAVGVLVLKTLRQAQADGDRIHAVIRGSSVVHAGRTNGYLVPNPAAQGNVVARAWRDAGVDPASAGYLEAHGAGTALGDPVEIAGLMNVFGTAGLGTGSLPIGSVKSTIGHAESAAGLAGLMKVVLQMQHRELAPSLHTEQLNPNIAWDDVPFRVQRDRSQWPAGEGAPRRAGVSSFGAGGAIAHVVVEEFVDSVTSDPQATAGPQLIVVSARDEQALRTLAERIGTQLGAPGDRSPEPSWLTQLQQFARGGLPEALADDAAALSRIVAHLSRSKEEPTARDARQLSDIAYTLQVGREPLRERLAMVVTSVRELCERLAGFVAGDADDGVVRGQAAKSADGAADPRPANGDLLDLAQWWVAGGAVDWESERQDGPGRIVDLPHYPFARVRCWVPEPAEPVAAPDERATTRSGADAVPLYERAWAPDGPVPTPQSVQGRIVCVFSQHSEAVAQAIADEIGTAQVTLVREGAEQAGTAPGYLTIDDAATLAATIGDQGDAPTGWIDVADLYRPHSELGLWRPRLTMLQAFHAASPTLRILQATSGLQDLAGAAQPSPAAAPVAGFVRALGGESATTSAHVLDLDVGADQPAVAARQIIAEWQTDAPFVEICHRDGQRHRPTLAAVAAVGDQFRGNPARSYVVTGGTRGIGARVARWLVDRGARRIALLGREQLDQDRQARVRTLQDAGAEVLVHAGSLSDRMAVGSFLDRVRTELGPIGGLVHCAGRSAGIAAFARKELADDGAASTVLEPKMDGFEVLHDLLASDDLDFAVLFSSICAVAPTMAGGVADYAAANSYLEFAAGVGRTIGGVAVRSIAWPQWRDTGGGVGRPNPGAHLGIGAISDEQGLRVLEQVIQSPAARRLVAVPDPDGTVDLDTVLSLPTRRAAPQRAAEVPAAEPTPQPVKEASTPDWLVELFATALHLSVDQLEPTADFADLGVESIMLGELLQAIEKKLDRTLDPGLLLDFPTLQSLTEHLGIATTDDGPTDSETAKQDQITAPAVPTAVVSADAPPQPTTGRVAIIGAACRFPDAPDLDAFWTNLVNGHNAVHEVPPSRWDHRALYRDKPELGFSISKWGGFVDGIEDFDPDAFRLAGDEARSLDPAIRMTLETTGTCLSDAGYHAADLAGGSVGVFVGARMSEYGQRVGVRAGGLRSDQNFITAYVAQHYDLRGPNLVVDSACSSSLVSVQLAMRSLLDGECTMAVAGGVEVLLDEADYLDLSASGALSPSGRCATFDESANGFVPGEGCGLVLLKPLDAALADGDRIRAVIDAVAVNNDGRTMGVTTPSHEAQERVVRRAIAFAGREPRDFGLIEAHGTGTLIGDPIELRALTEVFGGQDGAAASSCPIGSVKSNIGHLLSAAGIAGLLKVMLSIEDGRIPSTLWCERPNPRFDFSSSPFYPNTATRDWDRPQGQRVAGISSFGLGGTNAHAVLSDIDPAARPTPAVREPLPAPVYNRRRLWIDRASETRSDEPLVASLLDLDLVGVKG